MSLRLTRRAALVSSVAGAAALPSTGRAQAAANDSASLADQVDAYVKRVMAGFPDQPAVSVALVKDGQALMTRMRARTMRVRVAPQSTLISAVQRRNPRP